MRYCWTHFFFLLFFGLIGFFSLDSSQWVLSVVSHTVFKYEKNAFGHIFNFFYFSCDFNWVSFKWFSLTMQLKFDYSMFFREEGSKGPNLQSRPQKIFFSMDLNDFFIGFLSVIAFTISTDFCYFLPC